MKKNFRASHSAGIIAGLMIFPLNLLPAIEPPPDNSKPPAALFREQGIVRDDAEKLPFLGLSTSSIPEIVADHLGISGGSGVIIRTVYPDSPGEKSGLSVNDIILSIDGSPVGDPNAFTKKIRSHKVGDTLELDLIRKGKPDKVEVTLTERPVDLEADVTPAPLMEGLPQAHADLLQGMIEKNRQRFGVDPLGSSPDQTFENTFRMMREQMNQALENQIPPITPGEEGGFRFQQNSSIRLMDNDGSLEIKSADGDIRVTVRDTANKIVWEGPWNSDKDKKAAPQDIRERIDRVKFGSVNGKGLTLRFGQPGIIDN